MREVKLSMSSDVPFDVFFQHYYARNNFFFFLFFYLTGYPVLRRLLELLCDWWDSTALQEIQLLHLETLGKFEKEIWELTVRVNYTTIQSTNSYQSLPKPPIQYSTPNILGLG